MIANEVMATPSLKLDGGSMMPMIGYGTGTSWLKNDDATIDERLVARLKNAIELGFCHLDTAEIYKTEFEVGKAVAESALPRTKLFITTKVRPNIANIPDALRSSLNKLGLDYVDLYLIHEPYIFEGDMSKLQDAWRNMEAMKEAGLAKNIGVSNFLKRHLEAVFEVARHPPVVNQIEVRILPRMSIYIAASHGYAIMSGLHTAVQPVPAAQ